MNPSAIVKKKSNDSKTSLMQITNEDPGFKVDDTLNKIDKLL